MHRLFTIIVVVLGSSVLLSGAYPWNTFDPVRCYFFLVLSLLAVFGRIGLPQVAGTLSVSFVFVLLSLMELSLSEALLVSCVSTAVQAVLQHKEGSGTASPLFHVGNAALATSIAYRAYHAASAVTETGQGSLLSLLVAATILYAMNSLPLAVWLSLSKRRNLALVWRECNFRMFPFYIGGGLLAGLFHFSNELLGGRSPLLLLPVAVLFYLTYRSYSSRSGPLLRSSGNQQAELYMRTLEALAMSIEARDMEARNHLRRLQLYSVEVGRALGLPPSEVEALRAAAVLHDIGKLAVPEHILSKPGQLTREEFDKVKIHPIVGAEILNRVKFPEPVASIVRAHHERWSGTGYPDGLKAEQIPIGARILAAVDCLDALVTGRPYRPAIPIEQAMDRLAAEAGVSFDPRVVRAIESMYQDLEAELFKGKAGTQQASDELAEALMVKPAAANQQEDQSTDNGGELAYLDSIGAARNEAQLLLELTQLLGDSVQLDETLSKVSARLRRQIAFDSMVIYVVKEGNRLAPRYATGECTSLFLSREVALGQGITGWVSVHKKPILNGNPSVETGVGTEAGRTVVLNSGLAVPLPGNVPNAGVVLLCRRGFDAFNKDDLRVTQAVSAKLSSVIDNAIKYEQAAASASTDFLTGLPNARALNLQLEAEIARCRRLGGPLAVLVSDLDGFKEVNDRFGHFAGNDVLRAVARVLRENCREYDYVSRMGGDEFVILLPGMEDADVTAKIELFNRVVGEAGREVVPDSKLGLSIGQARFPTDGASPEQLLAEADQRMYQAKTIRKMRQHRGAPRGYDFDWLETSPK